MDMNLLFCCIVQLLDPRKLNIRINLLLCVFYIEKFTNEEDINLKQSLYRPGHALGVSGG